MRPELNFGPVRERPSRRRSPLRPPLAALLLGLALLVSPRALAQDSFEARLDALRSRNDVPQAAVTSVEHLWNTAGRIEDRYEEASESWRRRARRYAEALEAGQDPYQSADGEIVNRGYRSPISNRLQGYAIYLPENYDPSRSYPLYVALHGGSSNGNLFLGVVLGNNMDWQRYSEFLYNDFEPRWKPDWIVVAPTGFGQIMWRWMGEQDVLDVVDDVQANYNVDPDRVILGGLSNGGVGAYAIGSRHAWRFAAVQAMAGAPSWQQYLGGRGRLTDAEEIEVARYSGLHLAENTENTQFSYYHGRTDTGPMRPAYIEQYTQRVQSLNLSAQERWFDAGHDILYLVHRHGRVYPRLAEVRRNRSPQNVRLVTGDYRAARQHWLEVSRIADYPRLATLRGQANSDEIAITTENTRAFFLHVADLPDSEGDNLRIRIDGEIAFEGERDHAGHRLHFVKNNGQWSAGFPNEEGLHKRPGLAGPFTDAYYGRMVHVYGTQNPDHQRALERAAQRGARGWPLWSWDLKQDVVADTEVDEAMMRGAHLVLYGSPGDNAVLERIAGALPIRADENGIIVGRGDSPRRFDGRDVGARFVYPNPLSPDRYVLVNTGVSPEVVSAGNRLPEFLTDYIVYNGRTIPRRQARVQARNRALAEGYFDGQWSLPEDASAAEGAGESEGHGKPQGDAPPAPEEEPWTTLAVPPAPPVPDAPRRHRAPSSDPAGVASRRIWARVPTFRNYRAEIGGARWRHVPRSVWSIRPQNECLAELAESGIPARPRPQPSELVPAPVELLGPIDGVWFRSLHEEHGLLMSCEMALRLPDLVAVLKEHGVLGVEMMSSYRTTPRTSFHTMGLAWDINRFWTADGWLSVLNDFERDPERQTCARRGLPSRARALRKLACDLAATERFSTVLTPNYNEGHRDHFHVDARPDDPRLYLR